MSLGGCHVEILSVFSTGGCFLQVSKNKLSGNDFSVLGCFYFICVTPNSASINTDIPDGTDTFHECTVASRMGHVCEAAACVFVLVWAHVCICMPPCTPLIWSGPLAGNLSIEIRKRNSREECLWLSQRGIYNGL